MYRQVIHLARLTALLQVASVPTTLDAQALQPGATIRITSAGVELRGRFLALTPDSIQFEVDGVPQVDARGNVTRLAVRTGDHGHVRLGLVIGTVVGFGTAEAIYGEDNDDGCSFSFFCESSSDKRSAEGNTWVIGLLGASLGALVGGAFRTEEWEAVSLSRIGPSARGRGFDLALRLGASAGAASRRR